MLCIFMLKKKPHEWEIQAIYNLYMYIFLLYVTDLHNNNIIYICSSVFLGVFFGGWEQILDPETEHLSTQNLYKCRNARG